MAKDPAFLFYPGDWQGGTMTMTRHLKGCYIDLLMAQFNSGPLSLEEIKTVLGTDQASWTVLSKKFKKTDSGLFFNERLEAEKTKRSAYSNSRRNNRNKDMKSDMNNHINNHMISHMENENINGNKDPSFEKSEKLFFDLTTAEIQNTIEYEDRVVQKKFSSEDLRSFWVAFKVQYCNDFYVSRVRVVQHFRDWLKKQSVSKAPHDPGKSIGTEIYEARKKEEANGHR